MTHSLNRYNTNKSRSGRSKKGFTLIELIIVLAVLAILAAIGIPSLLSFIESGRQTNRMNIARTLYLAAQNQLTELRITGGLKSELSRPGSPDGQYFISGVDGYSEHDGNLRNYRNVYALLGGRPQTEHSDNENYVHYIYKPAGQPLIPGSLLERLMRPILDRTVLDDAIHIEFNVLTGVVLSVFYGDRGGDGFAFSYDQNAGDASIYGPRGMGRDGYEPLARSRRQGYYGVDSTSNPPDDIPPLTVNIYDGFDDNPIPAGDPNVNTLYVLAAIPADMSENTFVITIPGTGLSTGSFVPNELPNILTPDGLYYRPMENTVIWILDYVYMSGSGSMTPLFTIGGASCPSTTPVEKVQTGTRFSTLEELI